MTDRGRVSFAGAFEGGVGARARRERGLVRRGARGRPRAAAAMAPRRPLRGHGFAAFRRRPRARRGGSQALRRDLSGQARRAGGGRRSGRAPVRGDPRLRRAAGPDGPHHVLRFAALRRRHQRSGARQVLRRRAGEGDRARRRTAVLRARTQSARRRRARRGDAQIRRSPIIVRGSSTSARSGRTSSATSSSNCSSKSRCRAPPRGIGCSTRRSPRCGFPSRARS